MVWVRAAQPSPMAVAKPKGTLYHAKPPNKYKYPLIELSGREAIALCQ